MFHFTSKQAAIALGVFTFVSNLALGYFNIPQKVDCTLKQAAPGVQAAAAGLIGK